VGGERAPLIGKTMAKTDDKEKEDTGETDDTSGAIDTDVEPIEDPEAIPEDPNEARRWAAQKALLHEGGGTTSPEGPYSQEEIDKFEEMAKILRPDWVEARLESGKGTVQPLSEGAEEGYRTGGFPVEEGGLEPAPGDVEPRERVGEALQGLQGGGELMPPASVYDVSNIAGDYAQGVMPPATPLDVSNIAGDYAQSTLQPLTSADVGVEDIIFQPSTAIVEDPEPVAPPYERLGRPEEEGI
jgi:hypothetical protein